MLRGETIKRGLYKGLFYQVNYLRLLPCYFLFPVGLSGVAPTGCLIPA